MVRTSGFHPGNRGSIPRGVAQFKNLEIKGVGEEPWKVLWSAARRFSETHAYPDVHFPNLDGKCVLCLQDLSKEAHERFGLFEKFIQTDIQKQLRDSKVTMDLKTRHYEGEIVRTRQILRGLQLLEELSTETAKHCEGFFDFYESMKDSLVCVWTGEKVKPDPEQPILPKKAIKAELKKIEKSITELEKQQKGLISASQIQSQIDELVAKRQAKASKKRIEEEVERLNLEDCYINAIKISGTQSITRKSRELAKVVTDAMANDFLAETEKLRVKEDTKVELEVSQAKYGVTYHKIVSPSADDRIPLVEVLSEGEHRAIAIAAFLTEVNCSPSMSGIIFDDPVTSLDHDRKEAISKRLASEAEMRQVIVFTHDLPFIFDLRNAATARDITTEFRTMTVHAGTGETGKLPKNCPGMDRRLKAESTF